MHKKKICVVTGTRADYGLLFWLLKALKEDPDFELQIIATGAHLSPEFGLTYQTIEEDAFEISSKVEILLSSDSSVGISKSLGLGPISFAETYDRLKPDLIVILGDRYEMLAAAQAALIAQTPIAHIAGGDTTEGAYDEAIRHSITKMAQLHFVSNALSAQRVRQLGENPAHIYNVGSPGIDFIKRVKLLSRSEFENSTCYRFREHNLLVTFHPVTLETGSALKQFTELTSALDSLGEGTGIIFTKTNADNEGRAINQLIDQYAAKNSRVKAFTSLGQQRYLSAVALVDAVVGNSSSGLYEVPSFKKPTVNIGDRQKGRLQAPSVINCEPEATAIISAIEQAMTMDCAEVQNPYGDGESTERIITALKSIPDYHKLLKKHFHLLEKHND